jgi:aryl-alcohol dehydrogenase-like predicted oxidoreductase
MTTSCYCWSWRSLHRRTNAGIVWVSGPGDYAIFNSNHIPDGTPHLIDHIAMGIFDVFQIPYSAVEREHEAAITAAAQKGAGIVIRGGAATGAPAEGKQAGLQWERWSRAHLDDLLDDMTPMEFILRFTFTNPDLDTTTVGTINPAHLQTNLDILKKGPLPPDFYEEAKRRLAAAGSTPDLSGG